MSERTAETQTTTRQGKLHQLPHNEESWHDQPEEKKKKKTHGEGETVRRMQVYLDLYVTG